jgi:hypothetical protein
MWASTQGSAFLRTGCFQDRMPVGARFSTPVLTGPGHTQPIVEWVPYLFSAPLNAKVIKSRTIPLTPCPGLHGLFYQDHGMFIRSIGLAPCDKNLPFILKQWQFTIISASIITISNLLGQIFSKFNVLLPQCVLVCGLLYVAIYITCSQNNLKLHTGSCMLSSGWFTGICSLNANVLDTVFHFHKRVGMKHDCSWEVGCSVWKGYLKNSLSPLEGGSRRGCR